MVVVVVVVIVVVVGSAGTVSAVEETQAHQRKYRHNDKNMLIFKKNIPRSSHLRRI